MGVRRMGRVVSAIFLSASVPVPGRGNYYQTAEPFLIQLAVREFLTLALGRRRIIWGGHPAITPMVWAVCEDLGVQYADSVTLYQSRFFEELFPEENKRFANVTFTEAVDGDREQSLLAMRREMLSSADLGAAVFIGGMEGIFEEYSLFNELHPSATIVAVASPGGASRQLAQYLGSFSEADEENVDFARLFYDALGISPNTRRGTEG
jgi:hypothetical protein